MGPGDILTHAFTNLDMKLLDEDGKLLDVARRAIDAGVRLDVGHGSGSFSWDSAEHLTAQGVWPHTISSDIHQVSVYGSYRRGLRTDDAAIGPFRNGHDAGGMLFTYEEEGSRHFSLLECILKFLHLGMPLVEALRAVTATPAATIGHGTQLGTLQVGRPADIAVLNLQDVSAYDLADAKGFTRRVRQSLKCDVTIFGGRVLAEVADPEPAPWVVAVPR
jgi:dihydroorotase